MVPVIMFTLCPHSWCPLSCPSCFSSLGARHHVNVVSLPLSWCTPPYQSCIACLGTRHHFNILLPVLVLTMSNQPCVPKLDPRHHVHFVSPVFVPSCPDCVSCLGARHHLNLIYPPWWPFSGQTWVPNLVSAIMLTLCPLFWHPSSCSPCVLTLVPAIVFSLCPRLGAHYQVNLVSSVLGDRHHVHRVTPVLVTTIMSTVWPLS